MVAPPFLVSCHRVSKEDGFCVVCVRCPWAQIQEVLRVHFLSVQEASDIIDKRNKWTTGRSTFRKIQQNHTKLSIDSIPLQWEETSLS